MTLFLSIYFLISASLVTFCLVQYDALKKRFVDMLDKENAMVTDQVYDFVFLVTLVALFVAWPYLFGKAVFKAVCK